MTPENRPTLLYILREHNSLNGLRFVVIEFFLVAATALFISLSGILHGRALVGIIGAGIAANAVAVIAIAVVQIYNHDKDEGFLKIRSPQFRAHVRQEHPKLGAHTLIVLVSVLTPLLLVALLCLQRIRASTKPM